MELLEQKIKELLQEGCEIKFWTNENGKFSIRIQEPNTKNNAGNIADSDLIEISMLGQEVLLVQTLERMYLFLKNHNTTIPAIKEPNDYCFQCEIEMPVKEYKGRFYCANCGLIRQ